jgi:hypothetical protein
VTEAAFLARQRIEANDTASPAVFADSSYNGWRDDALAAISGAVPFAKTATIAMTDGTMEYQLPADWITSESDDLTVDGHPLYRLTTNAGAILLLGTHFTIRGRTLVLWSDPDYTGNWTLTYGGTWLITDLPNAWVAIALDDATARAADARAAAAATAFKYDNGVESVDDTSEAKRWMELAIARRAKADAAIAAIAPDRIGTFRFERT